jgi:hypothetical protein
MPNSIANGNNDGGGGNDVAPNAQLAAGENIIHFHVVFGIF